MAYTPPNSFTNNTPFVASAVKANDDALKIYLHEGIVGADLLNSAWVETRHVQAPVIDAFSGVQHGITGYQGASTTRIWNYCWWTTTWFTTCIYLWRESIYTDNSRTRSLWAYWKDRS